MARTIKTHGSWRRGWVGRLAGALAGAALLVLAGCATEPPAPTPPNATPSLAFTNLNEGAAFVGDAACFDCHEEAYTGYQAHGMAHSFYPLTSDNAVEDFSGTVVLVHEATGYRYRPFAEAGQFFQEEYREAADGTRTHTLVREMKYVVGSGSAARTYYTEVNGWYYQMPLTWYTQDGRWDFSPGYEKGNKRFDRAVPDRCMACHNSYPETVPFAKGKYATVPQPIGCERCHGPGSIHVDARLSTPEAADTIDYTIVNPAHLTLDRRLDVCQQCHLNTTVSVLREGRTAYDFRPGQDLADYVALYAAPGAEAEVGIGVISHADRMKQSACFLATQAQGAPLECLTCHNPHEGFREAGPAYFNETCLTCHAPETLPSAPPEVHTAAANCITCHMPKVQAQDAPHASFTDHWVRVIGATAEDALPAPVPAHTPAVLTPYFTRDEAAGPTVYAGMAYLIYGEQQGDRAAIDQGIAQLQPLLATDTTQGEAHFLLGRALLQKGEVAASIPPLERSIRIDPNVPERLNALALAYEADGREGARISRLYRAALTLQPALPDVRLNYGRFLETQSRIDDAVTQYQQATQEQPWMVDAYYNLGTAYLQQGGLAEAEATLQQALALDPRHADAMSNLGLLYASTGRTDAARQQFEAAVTAAPRNATALGNLGTFHLNEENLPEAIRLLTEAVTADPQYADGLANLALAHFRNDDMAAARRYAEQALAAAPTHPLARQILGAL